MQKRVGKTGGQPKPSGHCGDAPPGSPLLELRAEISVLRLRSDAAKKMPSDKPRSAISDMPVVQIFALPLPEVESLNGDRDTIKREERIRKLLSERGAFRLLGAVVSQELEHAISGLYESHPNFSEATDYILGELALARQKGGALSGLRLLLAGDAGTGKTDYALTLSKILGLPCHVVSMSSAQAAAALAGSEVYWSNAEPGLIFRSIVQSEFVNPLILIDELEKSAQSWGDPAGALYQALEPHTAAVFRDKCVPWLEIDASWVCWIATVNEPERLHPAIRSRFVEVQVGAPSEASLRALIQRLYGDLLAEFGLNGRFPERLCREGEDVLLGMSIRGAKRLLRAGVAAALRTNAPEVLVPLDSTRNPIRRIGFI